MYSRSQNLDLYMLTVFWLEVRKARWMPTIVVVSIAINTNFKHTTQKQCDVCRQKVRSANLITQI